MASLPNGTSATAAAPSGTSTGDAPAATQQYTPSQRYLSTRGGDEDLSFEEVVLQGMGSDGGLFIPQEIPKAVDWQSWADLSFADVAFRVLSLYISPAEIPRADLKAIIDRSYATFRSKDVTPLFQLKDNLYLLELFHGPTFAFKDVALQFLGNLFEYFLVRKNEGKTGRDRHHLTVVGATSGDTGSAAIYGLRGKTDVSVFILHPQGRVSPIQEAQMTTVLDANVHNLAVAGTFDDCQDIVKALFADPATNRALRLGAVNSINFARILAQITYYFTAYFQLARTVPDFRLGQDKVRFVVPTGNFGDVLAGYFAHRMGLPVDKLVIATNENDILDRFWKTGRYDTQPGTAQQRQQQEHQQNLRQQQQRLQQQLYQQGSGSGNGNSPDANNNNNNSTTATNAANDNNNSRSGSNGATTNGPPANSNIGGSGGVKETLSPAMDILVSSNFERLLWFLAYEFAASAGMDDGWNKKQASQEVATWLADLKAKGGFGPVYKDVLAAARRTFESERVSDEQTLETIKHVYAATGGGGGGAVGGGTDSKPYVIDPHTAVGVAAAQRSVGRTSPHVPHVALSTAHPAKFAGAVVRALQDEAGFDFEATDD
ncbi:threonine synthase [Niveomyces insectorum RCEF 264]|uniref:threonine synthase n=1 Tax=Niveomyces insectorum RCEF 264 TaxID=1081102 RepID=A0A167QC82_9HYPO|nr:threonine synthase [Niveomyces insectorum RCEF 264]